MIQIIYTNDTPNVSHFASARGKTGKSTARIASVVIRSICDLYTVNAGSGAICDGDAGPDAGIGEDECVGLGGVIGLSDGSGVPDSL
jgi:hypothetical protein